MVLTLIGRIAQFALMFMSMKIMTTLLPPVEVGKISLVATGTAFFALFLVNPVGMFINRRLHSWVEGGLVRTYFHLYCGYLLVVAASAMAVIALGHFLGVLGPEMSPWWLAILIGGSLLFNTVHQTLVPALNLVGRSTPFVVLTVGTLAIGLMASTELVQVWQPNAEIWLAGALFSQLLFSLIAYWVFFSYRHTPFVRRGLDKQRVFGLFHFCWPLALAVGLNWAHMQGYRFLLAHQFGLAELGSFAAGYGVASSIMGGVELVLTTWLLPAFYRCANSQRQEERSLAWQNYARKMVPLSLLALSALVVSASDFTALLLGPQYQDSRRYVVLGALAEWSRMQVGLFGLIAHLRMETRALILPNFLGASAAFALLFVLLPTLGIDGAPLAIAAGGAIIVGCLYFAAKESEYRVSLEWKSLGKTVLLIAAMVFAVIVFKDWVHPFSGRWTSYVDLLLVLVMWGSAAYPLLRPDQRKQESK